MIINFSFDTPYGKFADALHFADAVPNNAELEAMKQARLDSWIAAITAPVEEVPAEEVLVEEVPIEEAPVEVQE